MGTRDSTVGVVDEVEEILNDLLSRWHSWCSDTRTAAGYNTVSSGADEFLASCQYDSENGALDQRIENEVMSAVDWCIEQVEQPHRTILAFNAKNLCLGLHVWRSPRIPLDDWDRVMMLADARAMLVVHLKARGVLS